MTFTRNWLWLFAAGAAPLLLTGIAPNFLLVALGWYALLVGLALADWFLLPDLEKTLSAERVIEDKLSLGVANAVEVRVRNGSSMPLQVELIDTPPESMPNDLDGQPFRFTVQPNARHAAVYHLTPHARGDFHFGGLHLRVRGRLGMVHRLMQVPIPQTIKVYPNLLEAAKFTLMARRGRLQQMGIRRARLQGAGREFESLRDYMPDDELRRIDWKATARRGKLVARQYEIGRAHV